MYNDKHKISYVFSLSLFILDTCEEFGETSEQKRPKERRRMEQQRLEDNSFHYSSKLSPTICFGAKASIHFCPFLWAILSEAHSVQTILTEMAVAPMVARQTGTASCDWMTFLVLCWTLTYLVTVFPIRAWWADLEEEEKQTKMNWICLYKYGPKSESRGNLLNKTVAYRSAQSFGIWVSLNLLGDYFTVWFCFVQSICDWLSRVGCNFLVIEKIIVWCQGKSAKIIV